MKIKGFLEIGATLVAATTLLCSAGCSSGVAGNTYASNGSVVQIEFRPGGKAFMSIGGMSNTCAYSESRKQVNLNCDGDTTIFNVGDDGALNGPQGGYLARLTKKKE
jgi:hypothetical protein